MREILFRGKRKGNGKWVEGSLLKVTIAGETTYLIFGDKYGFEGSGIKALDHAPVDPDSIGEFTGLTDRNGKRIFEGDIVRNADGYLFSAQYPFAVKFCDGNFCGDAGGFVYISGEEFRYCEVIGNIHDNPELLEVDKC